jgi:hypothetical protein
MENAQVGPRNPDVKSGYIAPCGKSTANKHAGIKTNEVAYSSGLARQLANPRNGSVVPAHAPNNVDIVSADKKGLTDIGAKTKPHKLSIAVPWLGRPEGSVITNTQLQEIRT